MTPKLFKSAVLIFLASQLISCSKKTEDNMPDDKCDYVKEWYTYDYSGNKSMQTTFTYDNKGRITVADGEGHNRSVFNYGKNTIELDATDIYGKNEKSTFNLDSKGRIISTSKFQHNCKYNSDGYLVSYSAPYGQNGQVSGYTVYTLSYKNGNLVKITADGNVTYSNVDFTYNDKPAQDCMGYNSPLYRGGIIGDRDYFLLIQGGYFGKTSNNLLKTINFNDGYMRPEPEYQFDAKGRVTRSATFGFNYQCN